MSEKCRENKLPGGSSQMFSGFFAARPRRAHGGPTGDLPFLSRKQTCFDSEANIVEKSSVFRDSDRIFESEAKIV